MSALFGTMTSSPRYRVRGTSSSSYRYRPRILTDLLDPSETAADASSLSRLGDRVRDPGVGVDQGEIYRRRVGALRTHLLRQLVRVLHDEVARERAELLGTPEGSFQTHDVASPEGLLKVRHRRDVGAREPVDRLPVVSDSEQEVSRAVDQRLHQPRARVARVLELVDKDDADTGTVHRPASTRSVAWFSMSSKSTSFASRSRESHSSRTSSKRSRNRDSRRSGVPFRRLGHARPKIRWLQAGCSSRAPGTSGRGCSISRSVRSGLPGTGRSGSKSGSTPLARSCRSSWANRLPLPRSFAAVSISVVPLAE